MGIQPHEFDVVLRESCLGHQRLEGVFGHAAHAGGVDRFALQVLEAADRVSAVTQQVQHAAGVDAEQFDAAFGLVVQHGRHVGRDGRDVQLAVQQACHALVRRVVHGNVQERDVIADHAGHAHAGRAHQRADIQRRGQRFGHGRLGRSRFLRAAGERCQHQRDR